MVMKRTNCEVSYKYAVSGMAITEATDVKDLDVLTNNAH